MVVPWSCSVGMTYSVLQLKFLAIDPSMLLAFLEANLQCLSCSSLMIVMPRSDYFSTTFKCLPEEEEDEENEKPCIRDKHREEKVNTKEREGRDGDREEEEKS